MIEKIERTLKEIVNKSYEGRLKDAMLYALLNGGKRLRPLLMLKTLKSYGLAWENYLDVACSIEMIHTYSLVHDDLPAMDDDDLRRGKPTTHIAYDEATAILVGDALLTDAFHVITSNPCLTSEQTVKLIKILSNHSGSSGMVYGQMKDLESENKETSLDDLKTIHIHKTAKLIQAPLMMAAVIANEDDINIWEQIGYNLGLAFQIQDDILEVTSNEEVMGKTLSDERNVKSTYVKLLGLEESMQLVNKYFNEIDDWLININLDQSEISTLISTMKTRKK